MLAFGQITVNRPTMTTSSMEWPVQDHKFAIGQSVNLTSGPFGRGGTNGIYTVTQLMPYEGDDFQYRIKNANEPHERVAKESQLSLVE